jgi:hypothetical protein
MEGELTEYDSSDGTLQMKFSDGNEYWWPQAVILELTGEGEAALDEDSDSDDVS